MADYRSTLKVPHIDPNQIPSISSPYRTQSERRFQSPIRSPSQRSAPLIVPSQRSASSQRSAPLIVPQPQSPRSRSLALQSQRPQSPRSRSVGLRFSEEQAFDELERARRNKQPLNISFTDADGNNGHIRYNIFSDAHREEEELDIKGPHYEEYRKKSTYFKQLIN